MRALAPLALAVLLPACAPRSAVQSTGNDQEITRDLLWKMRADPRFQEVRVTCVLEVVTLEGSVPDEPAFHAAAELAGERATRVDNRLRIRAR